MDIKEVEFIFENCEYAVFPSECIETLKVEPKFEELHDEDTVSLFECTLNLFPNAKMLGFGGDISPVHRLCQYNDLVYIIVHFTDDTELKVYMPWDYDGGDCDNRNQSSELMGWKSCNLKIQKNSKAYNLYEIFELPMELYETIKFIGSDGKTYILEQEEDEKYLFDTIITDKLLKITFKKLLN